VGDLDPPSNTCLPPSGIDRFARFWTGHACAQRTCVDKPNMLCAKSVATGRTVSRQCGRKTNNNEPFPRTERGQFSVQSDQRVCWRDERWQTFRETWLRRFLAGTHTSWNHEESTYHTQDTESQL